MQSGGPIQAIDVCKRIAPEIAARASERTGWRVGRTAFKVRNPANTPDAWERRALEDFEKRKASGEDLKEMEHFAIVEQDGKHYFRYMKVIPTGGVCLICHGNNIEANLRVRLDTLYPKDQACGFRPGDIRGAFTITQPMQLERERWHNGSFKFNACVGANLLQSAFTGLLSAGKIA